MTTERSYTAFSGYTKHYFAGTERLASAIGNGGLADIGNVNGTSLADKRMERDSLLRRVMAPYPLRINRNRLDTLYSLTRPDTTAELTYFFHPDHLGSASWITDLSGQPVQHLQYKPFGGDYIDQQDPNTEYSERFRFTGKERDAETGYDYFGARYYSSSLGIWLSVDPMSDKYPSLSPYVYCADNPMRLVDPKGTVMGDPPYSGSGWGHGIRRLIANTFNVSSNINNILEAGLNSILQTNSVMVTGKALAKIEKDPAMKDVEAKYLHSIRSDPRFGKEEFQVNYSSPIQFGGKRAPESMSEQFKDPFNPKYKDTWEVAANELTWLVRSVTVKTAINVAKNGDVLMNHSFTDTFDLRPNNGRSVEYNRVTSITGFLYHDVLGGNDKMKVTATWSTSY